MAPRLQPYGQPGQNDIHKQPLPPLPGELTCLPFPLLCSIFARIKLNVISFISSSEKSCPCHVFFPAGAKEGGLFDDPSYVNVDKPRPPVASNGNMHRDAFDMSKSFSSVFC